MVDNLNILPNGEFGSMVFVSSTFCKCMRII